MTTPTVSRSQRCKVLGRSATFWVGLGITAMWVFFANQHEDGHGLGGIMFDDIGPAKGTLS